MRKYGHLELTVSETSPPELMSLDLPYEFLIQIT